MIYIQKKWFTYCQARHLCKRLAITMTFMLIPLSVSGGNMIHLEDYVHTALENNPSIRSLYHKWQANIQQIATARRLPNPSISLGYFLQNVETAVGPQEYKIGISQMIPGFGKLKLQGDIQALRAEISRYQLQQRRNEIRAAVIRTYYEYYLLEHSIELTRKNAQLVEQWETLVRTRYSNARNSYGDLLNVQIELEKVEEDLHSLQTRREVVLENFRALLNTAELDPIRLPDDSHVTVRTFNPDSILAIIKEQNPQYLAARTMISLSEFKLKHQRLNYLPDIGIGTDYIFTGTKSANGNQVSDSGKDPIMLGFSLSLPVWLKKQKSAVAAAENQHQSSRVQLQDLTNRYHAKAVKLTRQIEDAERKIHLYKNDLIPKSTELLATTESAYVTGHADFQSLIDAQRKRLQFLLEYERSVSAYFQTLAELELLSGSVL